MPIKIRRKEGSGLARVANPLVNRNFPANEKIFEIPSLNWFIYLHKDFDLIEASDENGEPLELKDIRMCCIDSIKLEITPTNETSSVNDNDIGD